MTNQVQNEFNITLNKIQVSSFNTKIFCFHFSYKKPDCMKINYNLPIEVKKNGVLTCKEIARGLLIALEDIANAEINSNYRCWIYELGKLYKFSDMYKLKIVDNVSCLDRKKLYNAFKKLLSPECNFELIQSAA